MGANHRPICHIFASTVFLCTVINCQSSQLRRCTEVTSNQTNSSESCTYVAGGNSFMAHLLPKPLVKLSELDDSVCNRIRPLNVFLCEVYHRIPNDSTLAWYVNINGTINENPEFAFLESEPGEFDGTGYTKTVSGFNLTASTLLNRNKTHCTQPNLISTLMVHPPTPNISTTKNLLPFNVSCEIDHTSFENPISVSEITHRDLTAEPPSQPKDLQLMCPNCNDSHCTVTVTWSPPENEDCTAFYKVTITDSNELNTPDSAFLIARSRLSVNTDHLSYSYTAVLPCNYGSYNVTVMAENICGLRSQPATDTLALSKMMCANNKCPKCSGTKPHHDTLLWTILTAFLSVNIVA